MPTSVMSVTRTGHDSTTRCSRRASSRPLAAMLRPVLTHRLILRPEAQMRGALLEDIVDGLFQIAKADGLARAMGTERFCSVQAYYSLAGRELEREILPAVKDRDLDGFNSVLPRQRMKPAAGRRLRDDPVAVLVA